MISIANIALLASHSAIAGVTNVVVDPNLQYQTFEGWGTSLSWWANDLGERDTATAARTIGWMTDPDTGLGYTVFRYNIGGGENPVHTHILHARAVPGFKPTESGPYDWTADAGQRWVLERTLRKVPQAILEAQSNSPPYWMTKSGCASGNVDGGDNLKDTAYSAFADYLTDVVKHFQAQWGITFRTLDPMNEPNSSWWKSGNNQEGCAFSPVKQVTILNAVAKSLNAKGLTGTSLSTPDANNIGEAFADLSGYDPTTLAAIAQVNTHSYSGFTKRGALADLADKDHKRLWQSESGPLTGAGITLMDACLFMSDVILKDLRDMRVNAWVDWQVGEDTRWGEITPRGPNQKFYYYAAFTRFLRPGSLLIDCHQAGVTDPPGNAEVNMIAALVPATGNLVVLAVNVDSLQKDYAMDLSRFSKLPAVARMYRTSSTENLERLPDQPVSGGALAFLATPRSVTVLVFPQAVASTLARRTPRKNRGSLGTGFYPNGNSGVLIFPSRSGLTYDPVDALGIEYHDYRDR